MAQPEPDTGEVHTKRADIDLDAQEREVADIDLDAQEREVADIDLDAQERELVGLELDALLPALEGERRERFVRLRAAVADGTVPDDLAAALASLLELVLQTARARQLYRAEGERILTGLLRRTPRGAELGRQLGDVNAALRALAGQQLEGVHVRMRTLGHFTLTVATAATTLTLAVRPDGVNVESVAVGEG